MQGKTVELRNPVQRTRENLLGHFHCEGKSVKHEAICYAPLIVGKALNYTPVLCYYDGPFNQTRIKAFVGLGTFFKFWSKIFWGFVILIFCIVGPFSVFIQCRPPLPHF